MHAKIKSHGEYLAIEVSLNDIDLLKVIKLICFKDIKDEKYVALKVHEVKAAFYALTKQGRDSDQVYQTKFLTVSCK